MTLAAELEIVAMFVNAREVVPQIMELIEMGHLQHMTPMQTNNSSAHSVTANNIQTRRAKAMAIHLQWLRCRDAQGHLRY